MYRITFDMNNGYSCNCCGRWWQESEDTETLELAAQLIQDKRASADTVESWSISKVAELPEEEQELLQARLKKLQEESDARLRKKIELDNARQTLRTAEKKYDNARTAYNNLVKMLTVEGKYTLEEMGKSAVDAVQDRQNKLDECAADVQAAQAVLDQLEASQ